MADYRVGTRTNPAGYSIHGIDHYNCKWEGHKDNGDCKMFSDIDAVRFDECPMWRWFVEEKEGNRRDLSKYMARFHLLATHVRHATGCDDNTVVYYGGSPRGRNKYMAVDGFVWCEYANMIKRKMWTIPENQKQSWLAKQRIKKRYGR